MSVMRIAEFMKINGSFNGGREEGRWFSIPRDVAPARARRSTSSLVPTFVASAKPTAAARVRHAAGMFLF
ncbi:MAG: hypothetical protein JXB04_03780 [Kiritimatiellae bacterium]|nr:hypothetical protein [Kiritimatiellia bacterium]